MSDSREWNSFYSILLLQITFHIKSTYNINFEALD